MSSSHGVCVLMLAPQIFVHELCLLKGVFIRVDGGIRHYIAITYEIFGGSLGV